MKRLPVMLWTEPTPTVSLVERAEKMVDAHLETAPLLERVQMSNKGLDKYMYSLQDRHLAEDAA